MTAIIAWLLTGLVTLGAVQTHRIKAHVRELEERGVVTVWTCVEGHCEFVEIPVGCKPIYTECAQEILKARLP